MLNNFNLHSEFSYLQSYFLCCLMLLVRLWDDWWIYSNSLFELRKLRIQISNRQSTGSTSEIQTNIQLVQKALKLFFLCSNIDSSRPLFILMLLNVGRKISFDQSIRANLIKRHVCLDTLLGRCINYFILLNPYLVPKRRCWVTKGIINGHSRSMRSFS